MAFWAPTPVPRRLLKRAVDDTTDSILTSPVDNGISALERLSLVELDDDYDPRIHRLLSGFVRAQPHEDDEETKTQAVDAVKTELSRTQTDTDTAALTELEKVVPHGQALLDSGIAQGDNAIDIANYVRWHQRKRGRYQLAKDTGQHALALAEQSFEPGHPSIATSQSNLALVLKDLGDLEGAKALLIQSYEALKNLLGENHPNTLTVKGNLESVESESRLVPIRSGKLWRKIVSGLTRWKGKQRYLTLCLFRTINY
jgi:tetratricopeptide (TPR) repeat protein